MFSSVSPGRGGRKDLALVGDPATVMLFDDQDVAVAGQEGRVVLVPEFMPPYQETDRVLFGLADWLESLPAMATSVR